MTAAGLPPDTIILIGAGFGERAAKWIKAGVGRIILVEPNPACLGALARLAAAHPGVEVIDAAIGRQDSTGQLRVFNLSRHSSLRTPDQLNALLPGLRQISVVSVAVLSVSSLLGRIGPLGDRVWVFIDAPGSEGDILLGLAQSGEMAQLEALHLACSEEPLYLGASGRADLQLVLEDAGFTLTCRDLSDPDWPHLTFEPDRKSRIIDALQVELDASHTAAQAATDEYSREIDLLRDQLHTSAGVQDRLTSDLAVALAKVLQLQQEVAEMEKAAELAQSERELLRETLLSVQEELQKLHLGSAAQVAAMQASLRQAEDRASAQEAASRAVAEDAAAKTETVVRQAARIKELEFRQSLARDELRRAEGQVDLIKDLLLRGERL